MFSDREWILLELLVLRCRRKDAEAASELTALFKRSLLYYLRRLLGSEQDAWDALQDTWLTVFRSLNTLRDPRKLPAFVYRVARNAAFVQLRKRRSDAALLETLELITEDHEATDNVPFTAEDAAAVHAALEHLSLPHREVLTLYFLQDLTIEDIALVVGVPIGTVKSRLFHAKQHLRSILKQGGVA